MKHSSVFLAASILATAGAASAACTDVVYLQSLVRTERSWTLKAGALADSTVSTRAIPMDSLILAAPPKVPAGLTDADTAIVPLSFALDCGAETAATRVHLSVDTSKTDIRQNVTRVNTARIETSALKAVTGNSSANNKMSVIVGSGDTVTYQADWSLTAPGAARAAYVLIVPEGGQDIEGAQVGAISRAYKGRSVASSFYKLAGTYGFEAADSLAAYYAKVYRVDQAAENAQADSVRLSVVTLKGIYDTKPVSYASQGAAVGIAAARGGARALVAAVPQGWRVTGAGVATGFVRSLDGRLVRSFPAGTSFVWDGRGAEGAKVRSGAYVLGFENGEAATLVLP